MNASKPRFRSLRWRINSILATGTGVVFISATFIVSLFLTDQLEDGLKMKAQALATLLGQNLGATIDFDDKATADEMLLPLKEDSEFAYVLVVKTDGTEFTKQGDIPKYVEEGIRNANSPPFLMRSSIITVFEPVLSQKKPVGRLALGYSMADIHERSQVIRALGILVCVLLIVGLMAYFAFAMNRTVVKPITQLIAFVQQLGEGDLRERNRSFEASASETLEIHLMREALATTTDAFRDSVQSIQVASNEFAAIADDLFVSASALANGTKKQVAGVNEAFSTAKRMEVVGEENAGNAMDISETAETSVEVSGHGRTVVKDSVDQFHSVREQVQTIVEAVQKLNSQLSQIDAIIQTVSDVAKQSQLLAVNASIEAAKAGEAGLRFAVVAREIKQMAVHSRDATDSVRKTLGNVKKGIRNIAEASEDGRKRVSRGMVSIENSGKVINRLAAVINTTAEAARKISINTHQQVDGLKEMSTAMFQIDDLTKGNLVSVNQIEQYGEKLNSKAKEMDRLVSRFRLN